MTETPNATAPIDLDAALAGIVQCATCGVEYDAGALPEVCPICADERQYLPADDMQHWADPFAFRGSIEITELEEGLFGLNTHGGPGIGQQTKIFTTDQGNVMVDPPASITKGAVRFVSALGPVRAIIPSHPHMYGLQSAWAHALGDVPVWITDADAEWLGHEPATMHRWSGTRTVVGGVTAAVLGGHFPGAAVVHWAGADGAGVLLSGDTIPANVDRRTVTFMRSYPNRIPLSGAVVRRIADGAARFDFDRLYDNFTGIVASGAGEAVAYSAERYARWVGGDFDELT